MKFKESKNLISFQKDIREEKVNITGRVSEVLENILSRAEQCIKELRETPDGLSNEEAIKDFALKLNINEKKLEEAFKKGVLYNIKATYKLGLLDETSTNEEIKYIIKSYTLGFRSSLSNLNRFDKDSTENLIFNISKKTYILPPDILQSLRKKYKDNTLVNEGMIKRFAVSNPTNPEEAIERTLKLIVELKEKYKDHNLVDEGMIKHFAVNNPTNPEEAIEKLLLNREANKN